MADTARQITHVDSDTIPALVVFGKNGKEPARGSWFPCDDIDAAQAGAKATGLQTLKVEDAVILSLASRMPKGRVFSSGKLFIPRIQGEVFVQLENQFNATVTASQITLVANAADGGKPADVVSDTKINASVGDGSLPGDWSKIGVGSLVLTRDLEEDDEAWYLAVVQSKTATKSYILKWRDYPDIISFKRKLSQLAILNPAIDHSEYVWN